MSRIVAFIVIYHRRKPTDLIYTNMLGSTQGNYHLHIPEHNDQLKADPC
jgi:hypothetical protein